MSNVDINDVDVFNTVVDVGEGSVEDAEQFFVPALPDDGDHETYLTVQESKGVVLKRQKDKQSGRETGDPYVMGNFAFKVESANGRDAYVFDNPTSILRGDMSKLQAALTCAGSPIPRGLSLSEVKDHVEVVAAQSPQVIITTQWEASIKLADGSYKTVKKGQKNFKQNEDGSFDPEFEHDGQVVRAQAKVIRYKSA